MLQTFQEVVWSWSRLCSANRSASPHHLLLCCAWCCCLCSWADAMASMDLTLATAAAFSGGQLASATRSDRTAASGRPAPSAALAARYASSATLAS
ncbi:hypothetical protein U9M48_021827 [Paspalum notatum var. saurae]|uniref:Secreted protein n=1 Tax=Paspalum notatum var. saurae TaxID=547442 RepID=A0AAQ3TII7_PASNO